jgi:hypothetical protein
MGATAKLHASGKNFIGYPCEWHKHMSTAGRGLGCMLCV